jgi:hypothetical protein
MPVWTSGLCVTLTLTSVHRYVANLYLLSLAGAAARLDCAVLAFGCDGLGTRVVLLYCTLLYCHLICCDAVWCLWLGTHVVLSVLTYRATLCQWLPLCVGGLVVGLALCFVFAVSFSRWPSGAFSPCVQGVAVATWRPRCLALHHYGCRACWCGIGGLAWNALVFRLCFRCTMAPACRNACTVLLCWELVYGVCGPVSLG